MKKIVSLALAVLLVLSLAACGSKNSGTGDVSDALTLLNTVWATYSEEEKFPVTGGDYDHPVDDAPGAFDISNADNMDYMLGFPGPSVANLVDAASLMHMMNANTFTCGALRAANADEVEGKFSRSRSWPRRPQGKFFCRCPFSSFAVPRRRPPFRR